MELFSMANPSQDMIQQLSGQLHLVSEIAESLTLRLLALEERHNVLSDSLASVEPAQADDSDSFLLLADSSDRLVQLRGLLDERADVEIQGDSPRLEMVVDGQVDSDDSGVEFELEQTVYVNDSQEPLTDTLEQGFDESDELLSA